MGKGEKYNDLVLTTELANYHYEKILKSGRDKTKLRCILVVY